MSRISIYLIGVLLGSLLVWKFPPARRSTMFTPTQAHEAITREKGWLNVSRPLTADDVQGRILLLDFWTFCCINCLHVLPDLKALEKEFGEALTVIGVHSGKFFNERDEEMIRQAVLRHGIEHPVVNDAGFNIWRTFGVRSWPTLVLINPRGTLEQIYSGEGHRESLRRDIARLQQEYRGKINAVPLPLALEQTKEKPGLLSFPAKLGFAADRQLLFVSDANHHRILGMRLNGEVELVIGSGQAGSRDGDFREAQFQWPQGVLYRDGVLYVADTENHLLRKIDFTSQQVTTLAGTGKQGFEREVKDADPLSTPLNSPWDLAFTPSADELIIAMAGTHQLWGYHLQNKKLRVLAGNGIESIDDGPSPQNSLSQPSGVARHRDRVYFVDSETSSLRVLKDGVVATLVGTGLFDFGFKDGVGKQAQLQHPIGLFVDDSGVYIADTYNHAIRRFNPSTGGLVNITGKGAAGFFDGGIGDALFNEPNDVERIGKKLYVADTNNHQIRVIETEGRIGKVSSLLIHFKPSAPDVGPASFLPNLTSLESLELRSGKPIPLRLLFAPGWKLNDAAPSWLAIFDGHGKSIVRVDAAGLRSGSLMLPGLIEKGEYRLQGTFYICEGEETARCSVKSFEGRLAGSLHGKESLEISI